MTRTRGRAPRGERLVDYAAYGHWKMTTRVAALRLAGVVAPLVFDGPMNGETFIACIDPFVLPTLTHATSSSWTTCRRMKPPPCARSLKASKRT